ncbi:MAG: recombinase family protein [Candidatus Taylorbacteria bacterium]|nr:recombinase family protein [Candidatus Taylorbacteria bacterium]
MNQVTLKLKYFIYCRKSTEGEERQALSIESQVDKAKEIFGNLKVVEIIEERKSAFKPYNRPAFAKMIERIKNGEADGIIAWHPDRLSRNEVDAATMTYMIRTGQIKDLKFGSYSFDNSPEGIMMLQMALSQSQYSSAKLSKDVKRGMEKKAKMGWKPGLSPAGYLNNKFKEDGEKDIKVDPIRFPLIRKMWDLMLTGSYSPPQILKIANDDWGYRTVKRKHIGGTKLSRSGIYKLFTNVFYAGFFDYNDQLHKGNHNKMITLEEFDRVQMLLGRKGKPRPISHEFPLTGLIRCGECGCLITAETKKKIIKKNKGEIREYTYYHCTKRREDMKCSQRKHIRAEKLEAQIDKELSEYVILPKFLDWALEALKEKHQEEVVTRSSVYEMQHKTLVDLQKQEDSLIDMRCRELINDEQFEKRKKTLQEEKMKMKELRDDTESRAEKWTNLAERTINYVFYARSAFLAGNIQKKREIFANLGQNFLLKDGKLTIEANEWFQEVKKGYFPLEVEYRRLELADNMSNKAKTEGLTSVRTQWLGW